MSGAELFDEPAEDDDVGEESEEASLADLSAHYGIEMVRAENPGPLTLAGTNTWIVRRDPAWVIDPGPSLPDHLDAVAAAVDARGGLGGVVLTHDHHDHSEGARELLSRCPGAPLAAGRGAVDLLLRNGRRCGPFECVATPGHAVDHFALIADGACFTGDAVLGTGSVFISPHRHAMSGYLLALTHLRSREDFNVLCPGHGPPVWDGHAKIEEYINHRIDRENRVIVAVSQGHRTIDELLDVVWSDAPPQLRPLATATLAAHLDKLEEDGILPEGVERPKFERTEW
jgi:glyoxylase-like metal-dependent hydrolase (beta-lactamase superfamily II)